MMKTKIFSLLAAIIFIAGLYGCEDRYDFGIDNGEIPEGVSTVTVKVGFKDFSPALSRSAGNAIGEIRTLWVVSYYTDGKFHHSQRITDFTAATKPNTRPDGEESTEPQTGHATFSMRHYNGHFRMYVVANLDLTDKDVMTEEKLRGLTATWNSTAGKTGENAQMFGWFVNGDNTTVRPDGFEAQEVVVKEGAKLHAWLKRCASKITVAYDGTGLKEGVSVYLKNVTIRHIPLTCAIGADNTVGKKEEYIDRGETVEYSTTEVCDDSHPALINKEAFPYYPRGDKREDGSYGLAADAHADNNARSLFFYENMQGDYRNDPHKEWFDKKQKRDSVGGNIDEGMPDYKDNVPFGTYVEIEAYYRSADAQRPGQGNIKYRFMLGKDVEYDYNAERNHHYKLTLKFKGYANDIDWHIDYTEQTLEVSEPHVLNYQGKFFVPDESKANLGHIFSADNEVTVTSYDQRKIFGSDDGKRVPHEWKITYRDQDEETFSETCSWLTAESVTPTGDGCVSKVIFKAKPWCREIDIDSTLQKAPVKGSGTGPFNLAGGPEGGTAITETANSYIVGAPGEYVFPLIYGNAMKDGNANESAYRSTYTGRDPDDTALTSNFNFNAMSAFRDYQNKEITNPWIKYNSPGGSTPSDASLVWQDTQDLITNIRYDDGAFGGLGGIRFSVPAGTIRQGNAVIAVKDRNGIIMWSWHIWVTNFAGLEETVRIHKVSPAQSAPSPSEYDLMAVNLGWCSEGQKIKYYPERRCEVKFTAGDLSRTITVIKKSHMAFPRGNSPYYQWGRKDPFCGSLDAGGNKPRYSESGAADYSDPARFYPDGDDPAANTTKRNTTKEMFEQQDCNLLIQNPSIWHNPPRVENPGYPATETRPYKSNNVTFFNLWGGSFDPWGFVTVKTVYDPCPPGYQVPHYAVFSAFTVTGWNEGPSQTHLYDVLESNVYPKNPTENLYEFYTDITKLQSVIFPQSGYRDWDDQAKVWSFSSGSIGYAWSKICNRDDRVDINFPDAAYNFEYSRSASCGVKPSNAFYQCDGFPVRPLKEEGINL